MCEGNRQKNEGQGDTKTFTVGLEVILYNREKPTGQSTKHQRKGYFYQGVNQKGNDANLCGAAFQSLGYAHRNSKANKTNRVVECNNGEQETCQGSLCFVLLNNHHGSCRSGSGSDCTKCDCNRHGQFFGAEDKVQGNECTVNHKHGDDRLCATDDGRLTSCLLQGSKLKLRADGECDKTESNVLNDCAGTL